MAYSGKFKPKNPQKYKGDPSNIIYRSSYELKLMFRLDSDPNVVWWGSEETIVRYRSPVDGKIHRYFIDFHVKVNAGGKTKVLLIEVKPKYQTVPPIITEAKKKSKKYLREVMTWGVNSAKWEAAANYARDRGWEFVIFTEKELGIS